MAHISIDETLVRAIIQYLVNKPWIEVHQLIGTLSALKKEEDLTEKNQKE